MSAKLPTDELILDERMQARDQLDTSAVDDYAAAYAAGADMPPVDVYMVDGSPHVVDGWHRVAAARAAGVAWLRVRQVGTGSVDEAIWHALASNRAHGVRRSHADKRRAVMLALDSAIGGEQSSRALAEHLGVSHDLVSRLRAEWESARAPDVSSNDTSPEKRRDSAGRMQPARKPRARKSDVPAPMPDDVPPLPHEPEYVPTREACCLCGGKGWVER